MPTIESISFRSIPHHSGLFLDYLDLLPGALRYFGRRPVLDSLLTFARDQACALACPRGEICSILERQNRAFGSSPATMRLIEDLRADGTVAVVTGQQAGLFTGPLYTVYKALTTIRIARRLREVGVCAVPLFWMDTEDHDLAEITRLWVVKPDSTLHPLDFLGLFHDQGPAPDCSRPVGSIVFGPSIVEAVSEYTSLLPYTSAAGRVRADLESAYRPGSTFALAFARLMAQVFGDHGLILFDPQDPDTKPLVARVFERAILEAPEIYRALAERNRELQDSGYHTQVYVPEHSTVLFFHEHEERRALIREEGGFSLKNSERRFSKEELAGLSRSAAGLFSPNVLLRPLVQDTLFPTVVYVAGPAEVAYFAQIEVLYRMFGRPMPAIWPRASFTLVDAETGGLFDRHGIRFQDCFQGKHHLVEKMIVPENGSGVTSILKELQEHLERSLEELRPGVTAAEASLGPALDTAKRKILHHVEGMQTRFVHIEVRHNQKVLREADHLLNHCYPNKGLQERTFGLHYYAAGHSSELVDLLYSNIQTDSFEHRILRLS